VLDQSAVVISLVGLVDPAAERAKLERELDGALKRQESLARQLGNQGFLQKAPPHVVAKLQEDQSTVDARIAALRKSIDELGSAEGA
jgi:valyl-tRNA synthetase